VEKKSFRQQTLRFVWVLEIPDYLNKMMNKHYRMLYLFLEKTIPLKAVATSF